MAELDGKIAVVTGGASGIGLATAALFVERGADVVITGRRRSDLDAAVARIGAKAHGVCGDVSKLADLDALYAEIGRAFGRIDILFANAAIAEFAPLGAISEEHFDRLFDINVKGLLFTVQKALPLMAAGGAIILDSSNASVEGTPAFGVYSAGKAAVRSFARSWTKELSPRGIRVNVVSPGATETPIYGKLGLTESEVVELRDYLKTRTPLGRIGRPEEVAQAVLFLATNGYVAGVDLLVDGGMSSV
ncbi:SDR family oxidoreductase [Methylosinus sp. H3A]|uniref:SDR family NAD(P)-dependent oxidoreductase n=1 Tax=Methylosinus sp. H3A TaxID=2785786 RepID=UPI0018C2377A|nr:SDR family oxidoreductase [Methylosinus sp. H3A]MBG0810724.1 SDR family oxidoreductase [Methylosinus sp. H3A]